MLHEPLSPHIKLTFGVCTMIGIAAFVFGAIRMQQNITTPFTRRNDVVFKTTDQLQTEREAKLKSADSDGDTLSDYDEMYVFKTSAFLTDTDSDGDPDNVEISSGQDPSCPKGKTCRVERSEPEPVATNTQSNTESEPAQNPAAVASNPQPSADQIIAAITASFGSLEELTPESIKSRTAEMPVEELHEFLKALGLPQDVISQSDTQTLRNVVQETLVGLISEVTNASSPAQNQTK